MVLKKPFLFAFCLLIATGSSLCKAQVDEPVADTVRSENFLPASTTFWLSVPDAATLQTRFDETGIGRLARDAEMQPFIKSVTKQVRDWADSKNVRLGLTVDDIGGLESGEICVAGILQRDAGEGDALGRNSHGLVFLVDVSASIEEAEELMKKVGDQMDKRGAEKVAMDSIHGAEVAKWKWEKENLKTGKKNTYTTLQTLVDGWLIASDNEAIFRDVIRRVKNPANGANLDTLSAHPTFAKIQQETKIDGGDSHVRWFIDPFGYMKLADAIAAQEQVFRQRTDNIGETLESQGFDAIKGVGGNFSFATDETKDLVYRVFAYIPPKTDGEAQQRARGILDFRNPDQRHILKPECWVADDCSGYATLTWNAQSAFDNVGEVFDAFVSPDEPGDWDSMINGMSVDMKLDLREMVQRLDNRFSIMSATEKPIDIRSERVAIGIKFKGPVDEFFEMARKLLPEGQPLEISGHKVIVVDTTEEDDGNFLDIEGDPDSIFNDDTDEGEDDEEEIEQFNLFEKRYIACVPAADGGDGGYLLVCNEEKYIVSIIDRALSGNPSEMLEADDYKSVNGVLDSMIDPKLVSVRQFGRLDRIFEGNYEMMRKGNMAQSQTVLARILNQIFKDPNADANAVREQHIDGSTLPNNYSESVAPFLGPAGYAMETKEDGWRLTGVLLKKNGGNEVVRKNDEAKSRR